MYWLQSDNLFRIIRTKNQLPETKNTKKREPRPPFLPYSRMNMKKCNTIIEDMLMAKSRSTTQLHAKYARCNSTPHKWYDFFVWQMQCEIENDIAFINEKKVKQISTQSLDALQLSFTIMAIKQNHIQLQRFPFNTVVVFLLIEFILYFLIVSRDIIQKMKPLSVGFICCSSRIILRIHFLFFLVFDCTTFANALGHCFRKWKRMTSLSLQQINKSILLSLFFSLLNVFRIGAKTSQLRTLWKFMPFYHIHRTCTAIKLATKSNAIVIWVSVSMHLCTNSLAQFFYFSTHKQLKVHAFIFTMLISYFQSKDSSFLYFITFSKTDTLSIFEFFYLLFSFYRQIDEMNSFRLPFSLTITFIFSIPFFRCKTKYHSFFLIYSSVNHFFVCFTSFY